jgi:lysozyme family protein
MADFLKAIPIILKNEAGYEIDPDDKGGETYAGITRKNFPNWHGWAIIEAAKPLKEGQIINNSALTDLINNFYKYQFWGKFMGDKINSQRVATFLFDWFVNSGYHAIMGVQGVLKLRVDGIMGSQTLAAINNANEDELMTKLIDSRTSFVKNIVKRSPKQEKFLAGWLNRINSFA